MLIFSLKGTPARDIIDHFEQLYLPYWRQGNILIPTVYGISHKTVTTTLKNTLLFFIHKHNFILFPVGFL